jgi:hypothetical protein
MGCISLVMGVIAPRLFLLVGWSNDQAYWNGLLGSAVWLGLGWLFLPWTTLMYGLVQPNGLSFLNWIFIIAAVALDLGTWGVGVLGGRKEVSNYRGT